MMTNEQKYLIGGAVVVGYLIYRKQAMTSKPGGVGVTTKKTNRPSFLSTLFPTLGPNSTGLRTTNMATQGGTASGPRTPSSGLGFTRRQGTGSGQSIQRGGIDSGSQGPGFGTRLAETGAVAGITGAIAYAFSRLRGGGAPSPLQAQQPRPSASGPAPGGGGSVTSPGARTRGASAGLEQRGTYDPSTALYDPITGDWTANLLNAANDPSNYDSQGNYVGPGAYDQTGQWVDVNQTGWMGPNAVGVPDWSSPAAAAPLPSSQTVPDWTTLPAGNAVDENGQLTDAPPDIQIDASQPLPNTTDQGFVPTVDPMPTDVPTDPALVGATDTSMGDVSWLGQSDPYTYGGSDPATTPFDASGY